MKCSNISWDKLQFHVFSLTMGKLDSLLSNSVLMLDGEEATLAGNNAQFKLESAGQEITQI